VHMQVQGACGLASCLKKEIGLTFVKEELFDLIPARGE
jgi:hypothetical protein